MTDKEMVLNSVRRLPARASIREIQDRVNFLAAVTEAEESLRQGEGTPHEQVKSELQTRIDRWNSKSPGRRKRSTTSKS